MFADDDNKSAFKYFHSFGKLIHLEQHSNKYLHQKEALMRG